jgi:hypothetical protein
MQQLTQDLVLAEVEDLPLHLLEGVLVAQAL